jgi:post-segregation antitoxin (ccd killing protein)
MRLPLYDPDARRKTVSVSLNSDLVARSEAIGIDIARVSETALIVALEAAEKEQIRKEVQESARFTAEYVKQHGYPFPGQMTMFMPAEDDSDCSTNDAA